MAKIEQQLADYLRHCEENFTSTTVKTKRTLLDKFIKTMGVRDMTKVKNQDITSYKSAMFQRGCGGRTVNNNIDQIKAFIRYLRDEKECKVAVNIERISKAIEDRKILPSFTDEEVRAIISECNTPLEKLLIGLFMDTAARVHEIAKLKYEDILGDNSVFISGKGRKERYVFITEKTVAQLSLWKALTSAGDTGYIFPSPVKSDSPMSINKIRDYLSAPIRRAGFQDGSAHAMRRSTITDMIDNGMDIFTVQTIAGHTSPETTRLYYMTSRAKLGKKFKEYQLNRASN